ncbi:MAG: MaoC family dehydratase [Smithellaceae bacterium]
MTTLYFEDFQAGQRFESPGTTITESQIIDFALHYDSQPFHMNVEAAKKSIYGGLIASGIQTFALTSRLLLMLGMFADSNLGSPGIDEIRWPRPVRPGDTLRVIAEVMETIPSSSKPDRGIVRFRFTTLNQRDEEVLTQIAIQFIARTAKSL